MISLILTISAVSAQPVAPPAPDIVVTAPSRDYRRALEECLARRCPTNEDVDATMALAESLFDEGEYSEARRAVRDSLRRNRNAAARFPEPVSDLHRASSRLARHLGLDREASHATRGILGALQAGLPTEDHRHFTARLEIAQSLVAFGRYEEARAELRTLAGMARAAGRQDVADTAELRRLWIGYLLDPVGSSARRLADLAEGREPASPAMSTGARMLMVRVYSERGNTARAEALIAALSRTSRHRHLLFSPPYELIQREDAGATLARQREIAANMPGQGGGPLLTSNLQDRSVGDVADEWIDVGFWISAEGRVEDLDIVRRGDALGGWETPVLNSIRGRRYTASEGEARTYRLERYTYTAPLRPFGTGTRTVQRSPQARVEYVDLSANAGNAR